MDSASDALESRALRPTPNDVVARASPTAVRPKWARPSPRRRRRSPAGPTPARAARRRARQGRGGDHRPLGQLGELLAREEGKTRAEGVGETLRAGCAHLPPTSPGEARRRHGQHAQNRPAPGSTSRPIRERARRGRFDHPVELPDRDPGVEGRAGACIRQHRGAPNPANITPAVASAPDRDHRPKPAHPGRVQPRCSVAATSAGRSC